MVDRLKDMIIIGGEHVYSIEVKNVLAAAPGVREATVFGLPGHRWCERVHAAVVHAAGVALDVEALREYCRERIPSLTGRVRRRVG